MSWNPVLFLEFTLAVFLVLLNFSAAVMLFKAAKLNQQSKRDLDETLQLRKTIIEERDSSGSPKRISMAVVPPKYTTSIVASPHSHRKRRA